MAFIDGIAELFCSDDELRPAMTQLHCDGDVVVATDAHALIVAPREFFGHVHKAVHNYPDYKRVIPEHDRGARLGFIKEGVLDRCERLLVKMPVFDDCETCEGEGKYRCGCCDQYVDKCKDCKGTGRSDNIKGYRVLSSEHAGGIGDAVFDFKYLFLLNKLSVALGLRVEVVLLQPKSGCIFYVGDVLVLMMPLIIRGEDEDDFENNPKDVVPIEIVPLNGANATEGDSSNQSLDLK